jgi:hypothetical protein
MIKWLLGKFLKIKVMVSSLGDFTWGSKVQVPMIQAILLVKSFKLVPRP